MTQDFLRIQVEFSCNFPFSIKIFLVSNLEILRDLFFARDRFFLRLAQRIPLRWFSGSASWMIEGERLGSHEIDY